MMNKTIVTLIFFISALPSFAQVDFLLNGPSAESGAEYGAYTALPNYDPMGFYYNPAQLGVFAERNIIAFSYPNYNDFGALGKNSGWYSSAINFSSGWVFEDIVNNLNISMGLGYTRYIEEKESIDQNSMAGVERNTDLYSLYNAIAFAISFDYIIKVSLGAVFKSISSNIYDPSNNSSITSDFGLLFIFPVLYFIKENKNHSLNLNLGYAQNNNGEGLGINETKEPMPTEEIFGYSLVYGFYRHENEKKINCFKLSYSTEAHNPLYESRFTPSYNMKIDFIKHVIKSEYENDIYIKRTLRIDLLDNLFSYSRHHYKGTYINSVINYKADTYAVSLIKILLYFNESRVKILDDIDFRLALTTSNKYGDSYIFGATMELANLDIITDWLD